jgi:hypothetical protein
VVVRRVFTVDVDKLQAAMRDPFRQEIPASIPSKALGRRGGWPDGGGSEGEL